jgi:hypothetical protein
LAAQPPPRPAITRVDPQHPHLARVALAESLEDLDRGRLSRTVRTQQREHLTRLDLEAHPINGADRPIRPN